MADFCVRIKSLAALLLVSSLSACGAGESSEEGHGGKADGSHEDDLKEACASFPDLPFCNKQPRPGFAKFKLGGADAVRWTGNDDCIKLDFRTGRQSDEHRLTKVEGEIAYSCDGGGHYQFVYRQHTRMPESSNSWTSAFRPLDVAAANELLRSCSWDSKPKPSAVIGGWWKANNTYAENMFLDYVAPLVYATRLIPFDDDGFERIDEETIDGIKTIQFRNEAATVWMTNDGTERPLRVTRNDGKADVHFTEWDLPFAANIPAKIRSLSEICDIR